MVLAQTIADSHHHAVLHRSACAAGLIAIALVLPACATVPRRAEVVSLASQILDCPAEVISVRVAPIDQICAERLHETSDDGRARLGRCLAWMPLEGPPDTRPSGWLVEGCGDVDRFAEHPCDPERSSPLPADAAFDGSWDCFTF